MGGDRINYTGAVAARTADMDVIKVLIHSVVSDNAQWLTADITDYYLMTPLTRPEYMRIPLKLLPDAIMAKYHLAEFVTRDSVLFEINKGMYGLPQAGLLAQQRLIQHLAKAGYTQAPNVPCLFRHTTRNIAFTLVVDDFGIKYTTKADADHLITTLRAMYDLKVDWDGNEYLGMHIRFDTSKRTATLSMPLYVSKVIRRFCPNLQRGAPSPALHTPPKIFTLVPISLSQDSMGVL